MINPKHLDKGVAAIIGAVAIASGVATAQKPEDAKPVDPVEAEARRRVASYPDQVRAQLQAVYKQHGTNRKARRAVAAITRLADRAVAKKRGG